MKYLILLAVLFTAYDLQAWSEFKTDVTQEALAESSKGLDHLLPVSYEVPRAYYIAQYIASPSFSSATMLRVWTDSKSGKYFLNVWEDYSDDPQKASTLKPLECEITKEMASLIYEIWANALLEVRYDRKDAQGTDGTTYTFSTFIRGVGWLSGSTWSPDLDLPPKWMVETGDYLIKFSKPNHRDPEKAEVVLRSVRNRLFDYLKKNGKN